MKIHSYAAIVMFLCMIIHPRVLLSNILIISFYNTSCCYWDINDQVLLFFSNHCIWLFNVEFEFWIMMSNFQFINHWMGNVWLWSLNGLNDLSDEFNLRSIITDLQKFLLCFILIFIFKFFCIDIPLAYTHSLFQKCHTDTHVL